MRPLRPGGSPHSISLPLEGSLPRAIFTVAQAEAMANVLSPFPIVGVSIRPAQYAPPMACAGLPGAPVLRPIHPLAGAQTVLQILPPFPCAMTDSLAGILTVATDPHADGDGLACAGTLRINEALSEQGARSRAQQATRGKRPSQQH